MTIKDMAYPYFSDSLDGTENIKKKYDAIRSSSLSSFDNATEAIKEKYARKRNETNAAAKISGKNALEKLNEKGLSKSGDSVLVSLDTFASLAKAVSELDRGENDELRENESDKIRTLADIAMKENDEKNSLQSDIRKSYLSELEKAAEKELAEKKLENEKEIKRIQAESEAAVKEAELKRQAEEFERTQSLKELAEKNETELAYKKLEAEKEKDEFDRKMEEAHLAFEREKAGLAEKSIYQTPDPVLSESTPVPPEDGSPVNKLTASELLSALEKKYGSDTSSLRKELIGIIADETLEPSFRYSLYTIGRKYISDYDFS